MKKILLFALICVLSSCVKEEEYPSKLFDCELSKVDWSHSKSDVFNKLIEKAKSNTPGAQASVSTKDGEAWIGSIGLADIGGNIPVHNCTKFYVASISKVIVATMIMQLHQEGALSINDKLGSYFEKDELDGVANSDKVTIKQLLDHTSGIPDYDSDFNYFFKTVNNVNQKLDQLDKINLVKGKKPLCQPGEEHHYSNTNYVLLGLIIEKMRGAPLREVTQKYIVEPLGLINFGMGTQEDPIPEGTARQYSAINGNKFAETYFLTKTDGPHGDAGLATSMQDLTSFYHGLFDGTLINSTTLELMIGTNEDKEYNLGIEKYKTKYGVAYGHSGLVYGTISFSNYFPNTKTAVVISYNGYKTGSNFKEELFQDLIDLALE